MMHNGLGPEHLLIIPGLILIVLWVWSVTWSMADAERRGKPGCLVGLFVGFFSWPFSLLMWIIFRPENTKWED